MINAQSGSDQIVDAVRAAFDEKEQLVHSEAAAKAIAEKNKVAKDFDARLQALVNRKADEENKAYKELIDSVYAEVVKAASSDKKFKQVGHVVQCGVCPSLFILLTIAFLLSLLSPLSNTLSQPSPTPKRLEPTPRLPCTSPSWRSKLCWSEYLVCADRGHGCGTQSLTSNRVLPHSLCALLSSS